MVAVLMTAMWLWHLRLQNVGVVDVGWTASLAALAVLYASLGPGWRCGGGVMAAMIAVWGTRLASISFAIACWGGPRIRATRICARAAAGPPAGSFFPFFQAQALLAVVFSLPALLAAFNPAPRLSALEIGAVVLWAVALAGEAIADRQLETLQGGGRRRAAGPATAGCGATRATQLLLRVARCGWPTRCSRSASPWGALALALPGDHALSLFRVTGIPATEAQALRSRGDDYRRYQQTTSAFVPWPPRRLS